MGGTILFFSNPQHPEAIPALHAAMNTAQEYGYTCIDANAEPSALNQRDFLFLVAIGGDGTILKATPLAVKYDIPILGLNLGRVGFLSEIQPEAFYTALEKYEQNALFKERRMLLSCKLNGIHTAVCLNEILLYKENFSGTVVIEYSIDGFSAGTLSGDGIIVGTPTGATGYSISAGGPIIAPGLDACIITPVCPHSLLARPIVAAKHAKMKFYMKNAGCLHADGQKTADLQAGDEIEIECAKETVCFFRMDKHNLFELIREKLQ